MNSRFWTEAEKECFAKLVEKHPVSDAVRLYREEAVRQGWKERTVAALMNRARQQENYIRKTPNWSDPEEEALIDFFQRYQPTEAAQKYKAHARYRKWPKRTKSAILDKVYRLTGTRNLNEDNYCISHFAKLLKVPAHRVHSWKRRGLLKVGKLGKVYKVTQENFVAFAKKHPEKLVDADRTALLYFLDVEMTEKIKAGRPPLKTLNILHLPTKMVYPTIKSAAEATQYSYAAVRWQLMKPESDKFCYLQAS